MWNRSFHEQFLVNMVSPQLADNTTVTSSWLPVTDAVRICALLGVGATDIAVDAKFEQATDSSGTGAKDVSGAAITQMSGTDDNKYKSIDLETAALDHPNGFNHVRLKFTVGDGAAGSYVCAFILRHSRHMPPTQPAAYAEQIVVAG